MEMRKIGGLAAMSAGVLGAAFWLGVFEPPPPGPAEGERPDLRILAAGDFEPPAASGTVAMAFHSGLEDLPASLRGTEVSGQLEEDARGRLKITRGVRDVFDYFLSGEGEEARHVALARIKAYIRSRLKPPAAAEALALLVAYTAYKNQLAEQNLAGAGGGSGDIDAALGRLRAMHALRRRSFDLEVVAAFFGDEETFDRYTADKMTVLNDTQLSPQTKAARLSELRERQPPALREQMADTELVSTLDAVTDQWKDQGGSPQALRQLRENLVGKDAADRLEVLDRETVAWNNRVADYRQQRELLSNDPTLADSTRQTRLDALKQQRFDAAEQVRLDAIDRIRSAATR